MDTMNTNSTTRQYGAAIALVSGVYSLLSATTGSGMMSSNSGLLMALLGVVVIVHGVVLLTPYASRLGNASGPLMIGYSLVMLLNQALVGVTGSTNWGMGGGMGSSMTAGMGWDLGMVALAVLMLLSGIIMTNRLDSGSGM
ncbi:hypothetical protein [Halorubrum salsamenti]|jgi:hypothetical protein|uniref:hypothetical protein n=1 Tax=Halorubrum salsamenti TaxID=2583990 RepID=UPI0011A67E5C|nr:hypothetical protein [Halorubrum salsamenti]